MVANCVSFFLSGFMNLLASAIYAKEVMIEWQGNFSKMPLRNVIRKWAERSHLKKSADVLTVIFQKIVRKATRTITNGDVVFILHVCPDGFWS